jgi:hypothetical protein
LERGRIAVNIAKLAVVRLKKAPALIRRGFLRSNVMTKLRPLRNQNWSIRQKNKNARGRNRSYYKQQTDIRPPSSPERNLTGDSF